MSETKIKVPEGMLEAAVDASMLRWEDANDGYRKSSMGVEAEKQLRRNLPAVIEAALLWQQENAPVPTEDQLGDLQNKYHALPEQGAGVVWPIWICGEWIRRMYDAPQPEVPSEIKDLLFGDKNHVCIEADLAIVEAFRRGQQSKA